MPTIKQIIKERENEFDEKYNKSPYYLVFKIHTGGFVNSDYKIENAQDEVKSFNNQTILAVLEGVKEMINNEVINMGTNDYAKRTKDRRIFVAHNKALSDITQQLDNLIKELN